jgi:hypothetical protein
MYISQSIKSVKSVKKKNNKKKIKSDAKLRCDGNEYHLTGTLTFTKTS